VSKHYDQMKKHPEKITESERLAFTRRCAERLTHMEMSAMKRSIREIWLRLEFKTKRSALAKLCIPVKSHDEFMQQHQPENAAKAETDFIEACAKRLGDTDLARVRSYVQGTRQLLQSRPRQPVLISPHETRLDAVATSLRAENVELKAKCEKIVAAARVILPEAVPDDHITEELRATIARLKKELGDGQAQDAELETAA
jgi:hypothetical protein